jgi:hypothetical protein
MNLGLDEQKRALGINPRGQESNGQFVDITSKGGRVRPDGQSMKVYDTKKALILILQLDPIPNRTQIIPKMEAVGGRLNSRKNALHKKPLVVLGALPG